MPGRWSLSELSDSCAGCEQSLEQACCGITPERLCGLCELLPGETLEAYAERWKVRDTVPLVEQVVVAKRRICR